MVNFLLKAGADANSKDKVRETTFKGQTKVEHSNTSRLPAFNSLQGIEVVAAVTTSFIFSYMFLQGDRTPLHLAAEEGYGHVAAALLLKGANVNAKDEASKSTLSQNCLHLVSFMYLSML
jgi:hypothetical protein